MGTVRTAPVRLFDAVEDFSSALGTALEMGAKFSLGAVARVWIADFSLGEILGWSPGRSGDLPHWGSLEMGSACFVWSEADWCSGLGVVGIGGWGLVGDVAARTDGLGVLGLERFALFFVLSADAHHELDGAEEAAAQMAVVAG